MYVSLDSSDTNVDNSNQCIYNSKVEVKMFIVKYFNFFITIFLGWRVGEGSGVGRGWGVQVGLTHLDVQSL